MMVFMTASVAKLVWWRRVWPSVHVIPVNQASAAAVQHGAALALRNTGMTSVIDDG
jgi:hypothetical protein